MQSAVPRDAVGDVETAIERLIEEEGALRAVFQPIVRISDGTIIGYEALARMSGPPDLPPDRWLELAAVVGARERLELACLLAAAAAGAPPDDALLFVNVSPAVLSHPLAFALRDRLPARVVLEFTETEAVADYDELRRVVARWKAQGVQVAVDDMGAGWSSLRHVVQLRPDFIKIDRSLITDIHRDRTKRALVCAMVAFARESGCSVIAEGVENSDELAALHDAEVPLVQGYLFARPGPPWVTAAWSNGDNGATRPHGEVRARLEDRLALTTDARGACSVVADHLWREGALMPSVYLERGGVLRCHAQRGLWQVLDGMPSGIGITGLAFQHAKVCRLDDVRSSPDYLEAIPGVVAELCVPVMARGKAVGSLNVESYEPLSDDAVAEVGRCATLLGQRLEVVDTGATESANQRLVRHAARLAEAGDASTLADTVLHAAIDVSGMDSSGLVRIGPDGSLGVAAASGRLASVLSAMGAEDLAHLAQVVARVASCYTAGASVDAAFSGVGALREAGVRSIIVVPLSARGRRVGLLLAADTAPASLQTEEAERMELLGAIAATCFEHVAMVEELRDQATRDPLTGLRNQVALRDALGDVLGAAQHGEPIALVLADISGFSRINDLFGHRVGDDVLCATANSFSTVLRDVDTAYRVGCDEFAIVLRGTGPSAAGEIAGRLSGGAGAVLGPYRASLSVGVAVASVGDTAAFLLNRAARELRRTQQLKHQLRA
ncbi:MAG: hypothetical protein JWL83_3060 [Actinomycetia bacterium]|nr:hypothetical protein [Actinomycetes bacterium]